MMRGARASTLAGSGLRQMAGSWFGPHLLRAFESCVEQEASRRTAFLWLPVAYGAGITLYFGLATEPMRWSGFIAALLFGAIATRSAGWWRLTLLGLMTMGLGFGMAGWRTASVAAPMLERPVTGIVTGHVETIDQTPGRARLVLRVIGIEGVANRAGSPPALPYRIKVGLPGTAPVEAGEALRFRASLAPPAGPALPGGFDFRREAFFRGVGAIGYVIGPVARWQAPSPAPADLRALAALDNARNGLTRRIAETIGGPAGAVAAALVTGKRALIPEDTNDALRLSGLYHIVSISGLHMVLAAGVLFWTLRAALALWPRLALRRPIKKYAAAGAMLGATAYCLFAGSEVATVRSLVMTLVMLGAILLDRPALAMRNLAISALIVLSLQPEALLGPSFQMSYAAVAALIASQGWWRWPGRNGRRKGLARLVHGFITGFAGILLTTLVASAATSPFSAYHFYRVNPFGLIGNALGIPLVSLVVMPAAVAGSLLFPFGLDEPIWRLMGLGIEGVMAVANWVARFENASLPAPAFRHSLFGAFILALLLALLPVSRIRWLAAIPFAIWLISLGTPSPPDIIIHESGRIVLARGEGGAYRVIAAGTSPQFVLAQWLPALGDTRAPGDESLTAGRRCDRGGCTLRLADGRWLAVSHRLEALREDCLRADLVVTPLGRHACKAPGLLVDGNQLRQQGTQWLWARSEGTGGGWHREGTRRAGALRPWLPPITPEPAKAEEQSRTGPASTSQKPRHANDRPGADLSIDGPD